MKKIFLSVLFSSFAFGKIYDLVDIYNLSLPKNESYQISKLQKHSNDKEVDKSLSSFYPKIDIETEYKRINEFSVVVDSVEQERRKYRRDITFNIEQLLYDRSSYLNYKLKENTYLQSEIDVKKKHQELVSDVIKYYLDTLLKAKQVELIEQKLKRLEVILQRAEIKFENGFISKADYLEAKLQRDEGLTQKIKKELDYEVSKSFLEKYTGIEDMDIKKNIELDSLSINHINSLLEKIDDNLDIQIQRLKTQSSQISVDQSISKFEPTLSLNYEYIGNDVPGVDNDRTLSLLLKLNIFNGFYDQKNYQQSKIQKHIETLALDKLLKEINQNIKNKISNVNSFFEIIQEYPAVIESKKFILDGMQERFNIGTKSLIDLLDEENEYFEKLNIFTEYKYQFLVEYTELMEYTNGLNKVFLKEINRLVYE